MGYLNECIQYCLWGLLASLIFIVLYESALRLKKQIPTASHRIALFALGIYLSAVFALTISPIYGFSLHLEHRNINLIPLEVVHTITSNPANFFGNIALFVPVGILLVLVSQQCQKAYITIGIGAQLSLFIEAVQLFETRGTDVDDVILNTLGTIAGYLIGRAFIVLMLATKKKIGVWRRTEQGIVKKRRDAGVIYGMVLVMAATVFFTGFQKRDGVVLELQNTGQWTEGTADQKKYSLGKWDKLEAAEAVLWDCSQKKFLYEKAGTQQIAPASTTKLLTALTVLRYCDPDEAVPIGDEVSLIDTDASRAYLHQGQVLTVEQLLYALLLPSGNDAAYALASYGGRQIAGEQQLPIEEAVDVFVEAMNQEARDMGAKGSNFTTPDGYDDLQQYTTAKDLACIAQKFCESALLTEIAGTCRKSLTFISGQQATYYNTNELLDSSGSYYDPRIKGLKTGTSEAAGHCLISSAVIEGKRYIAVVMGSTEEGRWADSVALYDAVE